jgi:O-methyltransferase involved in polyketide biosynthesis
VPEAVGPSVHTAYTDGLEAYDFERVSATALGPVIARGEYSDIPFAREMLSYLLRNSRKTECGAIGSWIGLGGRAAPFALQERSLPPPDEFLKGLRAHAPFFEARFKAVSRILAEQKATQIFELASGFSPRGLDPAFRGVTYVEIDLPKMIDQKREIVTALLGSIPSHLKFCSASVLNREELAQGLTHFRKEPVAVTSEGLLRYLTFDEKAQLAENVKDVLRVYGGVWITPDIHLRKWAPERRRQGGADWSFAAQLGRDINVNYFDDFAHARSFFEGCGFQVEERPLLEGIREQVVSLPLAPPESLAELESRRIYTMTPRFG